MKRTALGFVTCLALATIRPRPAHAADAAAAQALFEDGRALMAQGKYGPACAKLEGSQALDPGPGTQYNLALCYEKSGRTASAWATYLEAATGYEATNRPEWKERAHVRAQALARALARITIVGTKSNPGTVVTRDGKVVLASELETPIPVDPGLHTIDVTVNGQPRFHASVEAAPSTTRQVEVVLAGLAAPSHALPAPPDHRLAHAVGGVGVVGLAAGMVTGLVAISKNASSTRVCPDDGVCTDATARRESRQAHDWATASTVGFVAGAALVGAGIVLYLVAPSRSSRPRRDGLRLQPFVGITSAGLSGVW